MVKFLFLRVLVSLLILATVSNVTGQNKTINMKEHSSPKIDSLHAVLIDSGASLEFFIKKLGDPFRSTEILIKKFKEHMPTMGLKKKLSKLLEIKKDTKILKVCWDYEGRDVVIYFYIKDDIWWSFNWSTKPKGAKF